MLPLMKYVYLSALLSQLATAATPSTLSNRDGSSSKWKLKKFKSLVTFGDSYTDESRFGYFYSHNGSAPPVGWVDPIVSLSYLSLNYLLYVLDWKRSLMA